MPAILVFPARVGALVVTCPQCLICNDRGSNQSRTLDGVECISRMNTRNVLSRRFDRPGSTFNGADAVARGLHMTWRSERESTLRAPSMPAQCWHNTE